MDYYNPHIVFGTESWVCPEICNSEIFSLEYQVLRCDREDSYGGVFLACHRSLACQQIPLYTNCELVACQIYLQGNKSLIVASVYRPPNRDQDYLQNVCTSIYDLVNRFPNSTVWIGGDLWSTGTVSSHNYPVNLCEQIIDTFSTVGLFQSVTFPTRLNNTLDIFATNRPDLVEKCVPIPGISDHEAIYGEICLAA